MNNNYLELIRTIRREKNYSQDYMANLLNITQKAYSEIENGKTHLKQDTIKKIADILEISAHKICQIDNCSAKLLKEKNKKFIKLLELNNISIPKELS